MFQGRIDERLLNVGHVHTYTTLLSNSAYRNRVQRTLGSALFFQVMF